MVSGLGVRPLLAMRSGAIPCWGGVRSAYSLSGENRGASDEIWGFFASLRMTALSGAEMVPATATEGWPWDWGERPAKRSNWCPERKRIWIQRKM